jgi:hypothetical protein
VAHHIPCSELDPTPPAAQGACVPLDPRRGASGFGGAGREATVPGRGLTGGWRLPASALPAAGRAPRPAAGGGAGRQRAGHHSRGFAVAAARRASGLQDFGDESFREPLGRLLASLDEEAQLHPLGRMLVRQSLVRALVNRLRLEQLGERHPALAAQPVREPVFILGLQRTGTTLLHRLLTCESALRPLLSWEALNPAPFPGVAAAGARDPRMRLAELAERGPLSRAGVLVSIPPGACAEETLLLDQLHGPTVDATARAATCPEAGDSDQRRLRRFRRGSSSAWQRPGRWLGRRHSPRTRRGRRLPRREDHPLRDPVRS